MPSLTTLETAVLSKLLDGPGVVLAGLRRQAECVRVTRRELTGVGFFADLAVPLERAPAVEIKRVALSDVCAEVEGLLHGAGFSLFIRDGVLELLEGYSYDEPWPGEIGTFTLEYIKEPRDLAKLVR